jgi:uncharacterized protein YfbU (UPF0304 family)
MQMPQIKQIKKAKNNSFYEQISKVQEELQEFFIDIIKSNFSGQKEELCDVIQALIGLWDKIPGNTEKIEDYWNNTHNKKLENRGYFVKEEN